MNTSIFHTKSFITKIVSSLTIFALLFQLLAPVAVFAKPSENNSEFAQANGENNNESNGPGKKGTVSVCKTIVNSESVVVAGVEGDDFSILTSAGPVNYSTPLSYNTDLFSDVDGNDATCTLFENIEDTFTYDNEALLGEKWNSPRFDDKVEPNQKFANLHLDEYGGVNASGEMKIQNNGAHHYLLIVNQLKDDSDPVDMCPNIEGIQEEVPTGKHIDQSGNCVPNVEEGPLVEGKVYISKFIDGEMATSINAEGNSFPMYTPTYSASFTLDSDGWTTGDNPYVASTSIIAAGQTYSAYEDTTTNLVGQSCTEGKPYALKGYTKGSSFAAAAAGTPSLITPTLTIDGDAYLIVWNEKCVIEEEPSTLKVHIYKYLKNGEVLAQIPNDSTAPLFPMVSTWNAENIGSGSGNYTLGNYFGEASLRYAADTSEMQGPADYTTSEVTSTESNFLPIGAQCMPGKYRLVGYKSGISLSHAENAQINSVAPNYVDIESDRYVIVVNEACGPVAEPLPQCSDTTDNDGDGLTDTADPGCHSDGNAGNASSYVSTDNDEINVPLSACMDGLDNDGDGVIDTLDPGCHSDGNANNSSSYVPSDNDETNTPLPACSDGLDNDSDGLIDALDPGCHSDNDAQNSSSYVPGDTNESNSTGGSNTNNNNNNNGSIVISTSSGGRDNFGTGGPDDGEVLGASCGIYLNSYIKLGHNNFGPDVIKLKSFLNRYMGTNLPVNEIYDFDAYNVVKSFQVKESPQVLVPWENTPGGIDYSGTGFVYKTTKRWINMIECPALNIPMPILP